MAEIEEGFSLADFADIDVSEIEEVRFSNLPIMVAEWEVTEADLAEDEKDGIRRFKGEWTMKVIEVHAVLEPGIDKDSLIGRTHTERMFVKPSDPEEDVKKAIGRIRAFVTDIGCDSAGKLGDVVRNTKGHTFKSATSKRKDKDDKSVEYTRLKLDAKKK